MILLDEQMREDQGQLLSRWGIRFRQVGREIIPAGTRDPDIIPWLHSLKRPTFFSHDRWFFKQRLCHRSYCLVWLDFADLEAAVFIRRFLRHPTFRRHRDRMGRVIRLSHERIDYWEHVGAGKLTLHWPP